MARSKTTKREALRREARDPLGDFHPAVRGWFRREFGEPSPPQRLGWPSIREGRHTLIVAPTGSGKTLAAFLWCIDELIRSDAAPSGVRVLYISPLKALGNDIDRNLRRPLDGIVSEAAEQGSRIRRPTVAVRTGDTPPHERRRAIVKPPDILITTPESFYLMLTSARGSGILSSVEYVIIDEIHSLAPDKRGAHLALSMERLVALMDGREPVRIGLSATVRPAEEVARFLGGYEDGRVARATRVERTAHVARASIVARPVNIVDAPVERRLELSVVNACANLGRLGGASVWPDVIDDLVRSVRPSRSSLVFVSMRRQAERIAAEINDRAGEPLAYAHHGSLAAEVRRDIEARFKAGAIRCIVATASLELGIDIGTVDLVCQVQSPRGVTAGLQRVGRSGHVLSGTSRGRMYITHRAEIAECAVTARRMLSGEIEPTLIESGALDVLAQQVAAAVADRDWREDELFALVRRAYPYRDLTRAHFEAVLELLSGGFDAAEGRARPRISRDRVNGILRPLRGTRITALQGGGTIADSGQFPVYLSGGKLRLGELDEEFVLETRPGDTIRLSSTTWTVEKVTATSVEVRPAGSPTARLPFWRGGFFSRGFDLAVESASLYRRIEEEGDGARLRESLAAAYRLDAAAIEALIAYVGDQKGAGGALPTDRRIVVETFPDPMGGVRLVVHSLFGKAVNFPWGLAIERSLSRSGLATGRHIATDDGLMFHFDPDDMPDPLLLVAAARSDEALDLVLRALPNTTMFMTAFRNAAVRSLQVLRTRGGARAPVWLLRIKARDLLEKAAAVDGHPLIAEALRDILANLLDVTSLERVLDDVEQGRIEVEAVAVPKPSPFAASFLFPFEMAFFYEGFAPPATARGRAAAPSLDLSLIEEMLGLAGAAPAIDAEDVAGLEEHLARVTRRPVTTEGDVLELVRLLGGAGVEEIAASADRKAHGWIERLVAEGALVRAAPAGESLLIAGEDEPLYRAAAGWGLALAPGAPNAEVSSAADGGAKRDLLRRHLRGRGFVDPEAVARRYGWSGEETRGVFDQIESAGSASRVEIPGPQGPKEAWLSPEHLACVRRNRIRRLRSRTEPVSAAGLAAFVAERHRLAAHLRAARPSDAGLDKLAAVIERLRGIPCPAGLWETEILPARCPGYQPLWLDVLLTQGRFFWTGGYGRDMIAFHVPERSVLPWMFEAPAAATREPDIDPIEQPSQPGGGAALSEPALLAHQYLTDRGASFAFRMRSDLAMDIAVLVAALWELAWSGYVTNDGFEVVRKGIRLGFRLPGASAATPSPLDGLLQPGISRRRGLRQDVALRGMGLSGGRWSPVREQPRGFESLVLDEARRILDLYGVACGETARLAGSPAPWGSLRAVLTRLEERGSVRAGYFVEGLPAPQFAEPETVEQLRLPRDGAANLLNTRDPANLYGTVFPFPEAWGRRAGRSPERSPDSFIALAAGRPVLYVNLGERRMETVPDASPAALDVALTSLLLVVDAPTKKPRRIRIARIDGELALGSQFLGRLLAAGFRKDGGEVVLSAVRYP